VVDNIDDRLRDLQRAVDVIPHGRARGEILRCQHLLEIYDMRKEAQFLNAEHLLLTEKNFDTAMSKAQKDVPLPDYDPIAKC
jgi:hypothetical protein